MTQDVRLAVRILFWIVFTALASPLVAAVLHLFVRLLHAN
jgi:hypothetical protein